MSKKYLVSEGRLEERYMEGRYEGIGIGEERGMQKGMLNTKKEVIYNLSSMGISVEDIARAVNMPSEEVLDILNKKEVA